MTLNDIALLGGLYVPLVFWHFIADWCTQTEKAAEAKAHHQPTLLLHCVIYTALFLPLLYWYGLGPTEVTAASMVLFVSHWVGDQGWPVYWWARYIRRMTVLRGADPNMFGATSRILPGVPLQNKDMFFGNDPLTTPLLFRPILVITIDQLWHLTFLWVIPLLAYFCQA